MSTLYRFPTLFIQSFTQDARLHRLHDCQSIVITYHKLNQSHGTRSDHPRDRGLRPAQERHSKPSRSNQSKARESRHRPQRRLPRKYTTIAHHLQRRNHQLTTTTVPPSPPPLPPRRLRHPQHRPRIHRRRHARRQSQNSPLLRRQRSQKPHRPYRHRNNRFTTQRLDRSAARRARSPHRRAQRRLLPRPRPQSAETARAWKVLW
jgi:hypothetical protein